jgi:hypothetical protein
VSQNSTNDRDGDDGYAQGNEYSFHAKPLPESNSGSYSQEDMINITSCDLKGFSDFMSKQFGPQQFATGFELIKKN